ncbi:hypothetical protein JHK82_052686 [Glycine max]|nr:hypothetical protein JHK82_052686 [Glycine max]
MEEEIEYIHPILKRGVERKNQLGKRFHYLAPPFLSLPLPKSLLSLSTRHCTFTVHAESQNGVNLVSTHYDFNLFTIGADSDGVRAARLATNYGASVAICEFPFSTISSETTGGVRVADPTFLGYFIGKGVAAAAKVVLKAHPQEKVGVFVRRGKGGSLNVVEYSELEQSLASAGPNHAAVPACAIGSHSIGDADVMVNGGTGSNIDALSIAGFRRNLSMQKTEEPKSMQRSVAMGCQGIAPLTLNLTKPNPMFGDGFMPLSALEEMPIRVAMSQSVLNACISINLDLTVHDLVLLIHFWKQLQQCKNPFIPGIMEATLLSNWKSLAIKKYDGTSDPDEC